MSTRTSGFNVPTSTVYSDNYSDIFGTGFDAWIIDSLSDSEVTIRGYDTEYIKKYGVPFGTFLQQHTYHITRLSSLTLTKIQF